MIELLRDLDAWRREGADAGRAVVVRTYGSAPRREGATLLVATDGRIAGSVSGGCVEGAAAEAVTAALASGVARVVRYGVSDEQAWSVGLACGGVIDVLIEPTIRPEIERSARERGGAVATELPSAPDGVGEGVGRSLVVTPDDAAAGRSPDAPAGVEAAALRLLAEGRSGVVELDDRAWFVEAFPRPSRLVIVGAVQIAIPLVAMARTLGYETVVVDARAAFATHERFPEADRLVVGWPDEVADEIALGPDDAVAVLTHDAKIDEPAITAALARGCRYVGAIGSRKTQHARRERLAAAGVAPDRLARLRGPIGLDLGGREPAETALAIMAEIVADRHGAVVRRLAEATDDGAPRTVR